MNTLAAQTSITAFPDATYRSYQSTFLPASLLFHLEEEEEYTETKSRMRLREQFLYIGQRLQLLTQPQSLTETRLIRDIKFHKHIILDEEGTFDVVVLATQLANVGYKVQIRTALGGGRGTDCFRNLRHEFLVVNTGLNEIEDKEYIVDPNFREHFRITHPTELYEGLLEMLPEDFVGPRARLVPLVEWLCQQMLNSFHTQGLTCPPWRCTDSLLSKWLPAKSKDVDVTHSSLTRCTLEYCAICLRESASANLQAPKAGLLAADRKVNSSLIRRSLLSKSLAEQDHLLNCFGKQAEICTSQHHVVRLQGFVQ